jgi:abortive infection bacteriophage resistance protein
MPRVPYVKPALSLTDQLTQLKKRGLKVEDEGRALHLLESISYYRLSGYWYPMLEMPKENHVFKPNSSFDSAFKIYCFDKELRKIILTEIEKIEIAVRSKMIYIL